MYASSSFEARQYMYSINSLPYAVNTHHCRAGSSHPWALTCGHPWPQKPGTGECLQRALFKNAATLSIATTAIVSKPDSGT